MALAFFLGMCSFLACIQESRNCRSVLGFAVVFVLGVTCPLNRAALHAASWRRARSRVDGSRAHQPLVPDSFLTLIGTIAATVQIVEMALDRFSPQLYNALGVFLPLIAVNCAILGASLFMVQRDYNLARERSLRDRLRDRLGCWPSWRWPRFGRSCDTATFPRPLRGLGVTFIVVGLMSDWLHGLLGDSALTDPARSGTQVVASYVHYRTLRRRRIHGGHHRPPGGGAPLRQEPGWWPAGEVDDPHQRRSRQGDHTRPAATPCSTRCRPTASSSPRPAAGRGAAASARSRSSRAAAPCCPPRRATSRAARSPRGLPPLLPGEGQGET